MRRLSCPIKHVEQACLKSFPGPSEGQLILPLGNTSQHEISRIHLTLINFIKNEGKKLGSLCNRYRLGSLCKFLIQQKKFVSHYFPSQFQEIQKIIHSTS